MPTIIACAAFPSYNSVFDNMNFSFPRYVDEIQCAAARVIEQIRIRSRAKSGESKENSGSYDSFHIRRGDFQYQDVWLPAEAIYEENTKLFVPDGRTVYIATDEKNKTFFEPFREHYNVLFLDDFAAQLVGISPNYYGMLDQLIASRGDVFVGAYYSTFTGYINRMRGYHAQKDPTLEGYDQGVMKSYYYVPAHMANLRTILQQYGAVQPAFWAQEFPVAWRDLDHNV